MKLLLVVLHKLCYRPTATYRCAQFNATWLSPALQDVRQFSQEYSFNLSTTLDERDFQTILGIVFLMSVWWHNKHSVKGTCTRISLGVTFK